MVTRVMDMLSRQTVEPQLSARQHRARGLTLPNEVDGIPCIVQWIDYDPSMLGYVAGLCSGCEMFLPIECFDDVSIDAVYRGFELHAAAEWRYIHYYTPDTTEVPLDLESPPKRVTLPRTRRIRLR